jgi:hypothetical protein
MLWIRSPVRKLKKLDRFAFLSRKKQTIAIGTGSTDTVQNRTAELSSPYQTYWQYFGGQFRPSKEQETNRCERLGEPSGLRFSCAWR